MSAPVPPYGIDTPNMSPSKKLYGVCEVLRPKYHCKVLCVKPRFYRNLSDRMEGFINSKGFTAYWIYTWNFTVGVL